MREALRAIDRKLLQAAQIGGVQALPACMDAQNEIGWAPLMEAAWRGREDSVCAIIEAGADVDARNNDKSICLIPAVNSGYSPAIPCQKA